MPEEKEGGIPPQEKINIPAGSEIEDETMEQFKQRVEEQTGMKFDDIPHGEENDIIDGHIFCKHGDVYVVGIGYPEEEEEGEEVYSEFRVVDLSEKN